MKSAGKLLIALIFACQIGGLSLAADGISTVSGQAEKHHVLSVDKKDMQFAASEGRADKKLQDMIKETQGNFHQYSYHDRKTGTFISYNLYIPAEYRPGGIINYPLVVFIGDARTVGEDVQAPLKQGYGGIIWATKQEQKKHPCFVLVPQYKKVVIDDQDGYKVSDEAEATARLIHSVALQYGIDEKRIYGTGQSMGGMLTMYLAAENPDLYAAALVVSGQWSAAQLKPLGAQNFFYIAAAGDSQAMAGQNELLPLMKSSGANTVAMQLDVKKDSKELTKEIDKEISKNKKSHVYFASFALGNVPFDKINPKEYPSYFDQVYEIDALRDWLFKQKR